MPISTDRPGPNPSAPTTPAAGRGPRSARPVASPRAWTTAGALGLALLAGCGTTALSATAPPPASPASSPAATAAQPIFAGAELVWAQGSLVHVDDAVYDLSPQVIDWLAWSPSRLYLGQHAGEEHRVVWFDGSSQAELGAVDGRVVTSPTGELAAWIDRAGPQRPAGQVAQLVVQDTVTGEIVHRTSEGMGGEEGDDLGDRYEELPPSVTAIRDRPVFWTDAEGGGSHVATDVTTGESRRDEAGWPLPLALTSGYEFSSPDGAFEVDASETGKLRVSPRQPEFRGPYQTQAGWIGGHTLLAVVQDEFAWSFDPNQPDRTPGAVVACDLEAATCIKLVDVVGVRDLAFAGAPEE